MMRQAPVLEKATDMVKLTLERDRSGTNMLNPIYRYAPKLVTHSNLTKSLIVVQRTQ